MVRRLMEYNNTPWSFMGEVNCWWSEGRHYRQAAMNELIHHALTSAAMLARLESPRLLQNAVKARDQMVFQWYFGSTESL